MANQTWGYDFFLAAQKSLSQSGVAFLSEKLRQYQTQVEEAEKRYDFASKAERLQVKGMSQGAYERYLAEVKAAKSSLWRNVTENAGYGLELQFKMYASEEVWQKLIGKAMEEMLLGKIKSIMTHE